MSFSARRTASAKANPRIAVMSLRNVESHVSRCCGYEFEDIICEELDFARLVMPAPPAGSFGGLKQRLRNRAIEKVGYKGALSALNSSARHAHLGQDYDLFFFSAAQPRDLAELTNVPDWRERSGFAVCWIQELWVRDITEENRLLDILEEFDHVICSFHLSVEALGKRISTPVTYLPWGIDTMLFCPYPEPPQRAIEVAGIGAVPKAAEQALVRHADETGSFFHYQTVFGPSTVKSHREHRHNLAGILKRSEFFLCYIAKFANSEREQQVEFGLRYIEGIAAGTILLGDPVDNPAFRKYLGWSDSLIALDADDPAPDRLVKTLLAQPERLAEARCKNIVNALLTLDNLHRWQDILKLAGLPETPAMRQRQNRLQALADRVLLDTDGSVDEFMSEGLPRSAG